VRSPRLHPFIAFAVLLLTALGSRADDWPQWRGPERDGVWRETGILEAIPPGGLKVRWRARVGNGYSGPAVARGRVYVTDHLYATEVERVLCFDEATGKQLWAHSYPCEYADMEYGNGPRATPTVHDGRVYTFGTKGHLICLDAVKGNVLWKKDLAKEFKARILRYGDSAAPLVEGDLLIVVAGAQPDGCVMAFDRKTGEVRWKALKDRPAYSAPIVVTAGGCRQLIVWTADTIASLEPATGKVFWQVLFKATFDEAQMVASPVLHNDMLLCLGAWGRGSKMLKLDATKPAASVLWQTSNKPTTTISTPLFLDENHFYAVLIDGHLACLDATTGDQEWATAEPTSKGRGNAHLTPNGDRVFLFNQSGNLILARLTPKGYQELGRTLLVEPTAGYRPQGAVAWAHPAYANKCVFARNDRELVCASLAADSVAAAPEPKQNIKARVLIDYADVNAALGLAFSPDGKTLALGTWSGQVKLLDLSTGKEVPGPTRHNDWVCSVAFSPDGKFLVSAGGSEFRPARNKGTTTGQVKLWDRASGKEIGQLTGHTSKVLSAAFSPDGKTLATGSADRTVRVWDLPDGKERFVLKGHAEAVWCVAFSPDGNTVFSASADKTVKVWDVATGKERQSLTGHDEEVLAVAISPDGKTLATGGADWTVRLWDVATAKERAVLKGHRGSVYSLALTSDSKTLASGSGDQTVKLWDVATGKERTTLRGHRSGVTAIALSPDDRRLASAGMDDAVRLWDLSQPE
jgi:outer membrane protein assembly factor BamB